MRLVLVAYRWTAAKELALLRLIRGWLDPKMVVLVENFPSPDFQSPNFSMKIGTNQYAEFSGYLEGLDEIDTGPILVLNDTALAHHSSTFWRIQLKKWRTEQNMGIFGDPRHEQFSTEHGVLQYYASWIFWLPSPEDIMQFRAALNQVIDCWDLTFSTSPEYRSFVATYLKGSLFHGWKNAGLRDQKAQDVKIRCIWAEHRLSQTLWDSGVVFQLLSGKHVVAMRGLDRLYSFRRRAQSFLK